MSFPKQMTATTTIRVARFVTPDGTNNNSVKESNSGDLPSGISQLGSREAPLPSVTTDPPNAAIAGEPLNVFPNGTQTVLRIGSGGITAGALLKPDNDGNGVALANSGTEAYGARALEAASEGHLCQVEVLIGYKTT